jgi:hypothetical protein
MTVSKVSPDWPTKVAILFLASVSWDPASVIGLLMTTSSVSAYPRSHVKRLPAPGLLAIAG